MNDRPSPDQPDPPVRVVVPLFGLSPEHAPTLVGYTQLIDLVQRSYPQRFTGPPGTSPFEAWEVLRAAFVARMTAVAVSLRQLLPTQSYTDGATLARSLIDHAIHFAWIAAAPEERCPVFVRHEYQRRLDYDRDQARDGAEPPLSDESRAAMRAFVRQPLRDLPGLRTMAEEADAHWLQRVEGLAGEGLTPIARIYGVTYNAFSRLSHPSVMGLQQFWELRGAHLVIPGVEAGDPNLRPYRVGLLVYGYALLVSGLHFGVPDPEHTRRALDFAASIQQMQREGRLEVRPGPDGSITLDARVE